MNYHFPRNVSDSTSFQNKSNSSESEWDYGNDSSESNGPVEPVMPLAQTSNVSQKKPVLRISSTLKKRIDFIARKVTGKTKYEIDILAGADNVYDDRPISGLSEDDIESVNNYFKNEIKGMISSS